MEFILTVGVDTMMSKLVQIITLGLNLDQATIHEIRGSFNASIRYYYEIYVRLRQFCPQFHCPFSNAFHSHVLLIQVCEGVYLSTNYSLLSIVSADQYWYCS